MKRPANSFAFWPWSASRLHSAKEWLVLDLGHRTLKALQIAASREGIQSCKCEAVGLERDLSEPLLAERVASLLPPHSESAVALLLPEQMAISQVIDLPASSPEEVARRIDAETVAISGLSENVIVHDYARLDPIGEKRNPFWLTLCQESEILKQADRLQLRERIAEITTSANALIAAHRFQFHQASDRILIDIGATTTVIAIIRAGQGVFAGTVPVGADSFTEAIAREQNCSWEAAEDLKLSEQFLSGANSSAELIRALHSWQRQVESVVSEFDGSGLATHSILLCGGGSLLAGLTEYLKSTHWNASLWPNQGLPEGITPIWIPVFGMALQATGQNRQSISLLPEELQRIQIRQRRLQAVNSLNVFLMCVLL
ncbi:MAG: pilus assembly protein PilM, partial [Verrucomicrobiota bacterium]